MIPVSILLFGRSLVTDRDNFEVATSGQFVKKRNRAQRLGRDRL
jgi:hypothetical protein